MDFKGWSAGGMDRGRKAWGAMVRRWWGRVGGLARALPCRAPCLALPCALLACRARALPCLAYASGQYPHMGTCCAPCLAWRALLHLAAIGNVSRRGVAYIGAQCSAVYWHGVAGCVGVGIHFVKPWVTLRYMGAPCGAPCCVA